MKLSKLKSELSFPKLVSAIYDPDSYSLSRLAYLLPLALLSTQFFYTSSDDTYLPHSPILPRPTIVTDYLPLYRHITYHDDERERLAQENGGDEFVGLGGRGAGVRRSTRVVGGAGRVKVRKDIEWSRKEDAEWVRKSGFEGL